MKKILIMTILLSLILFGIIKTIPNNALKNNNLNDNNINITQNTVATPITIYKVKRGQINDSIFTLGEVAPSKIYDVNSKINGKVKKVYFKVGDIVKKNDLLFEMETSVFNSDKITNLNKLKNQVDLAKKSLEDSLNTLNNTKSLYESGAVSKDQLEKVILNYENTLNNYKNALSAYNNMEINYNNQNDYYKVKSPIDGIITSKNIEEGMFASVNNGFKIISNNNLIIKATIASKYINSIHENQDVEIYINSIDRNYLGKVSTISYSAKNGSYPIEISIINSDKYIHTGMYSELNIKLNTKENVLLVPINSIVNENNETFVYKIVDNKAIKVIVQEGIINENLAEILGNLKENDIIAVKGKEYLKNGTKITITN